MGEDRIMICTQGTDLKNIIDQFEPARILEIIPENEIKNFIDRKKENDL